MPSCSAGLLRLRALRACGLCTSWATLSPPLASAPAGRNLGNSTAIRAVSTAPSADAPIVPPIERKNVTDEVATPICRHRHGVLHDQGEHLHEQPEPGAEDQDVDADDGQRRVRADAGEQHQTRR